MAVDPTAHGEDPRALAFAAAYPEVPIPPSGPVNTAPIMLTPSTGYDALWRSIDPELRSRANDVHLPISAAYAARLCDAYPQADRDLVLVAIILHDTGWAHVDQSRLISEGFRGSGDWRKELIRFEHEVHGCAVARRVLSALGYDRDFIARVCEIIDGHDTRHVAYSLEDALVRDADRLWRFDGPGIALSTQWTGMEVTGYMDHVEALYVPELITEAAVQIARNDLARHRGLLRTSRI
nr:HD domain-containing protein [uncultured Citricoccus sp.]